MSVKQITATMVNGQNRIQVTQTDYNIVMFKEIKKPHSNVYRFQLYLYHIGGASTFNQVLYTSVATTTTTYVCSTLIEIIYTYILQNGQAGQGSPRSGRTPGRALRQCTLKLHGTLPGSPVRYVKLHERVYNTIVGPPVSCPLFHNHPCFAVLGPNFSFRSLWVARRINFPSVLCNFNALLTSLIRILNEK